MNNIKFFDFREISDYFYNLIVENSNVFEGIIAPKNILQEQNASGDANISVLSNWIPITDLNELSPMYEDAWDDRFLGFGTLIQASGGHEKSSQEAFIISTSIIQRLKILLDNYNGINIKTDKMDMTIYNIDYLSVTDTNNPTSDFALSICRIIGIWKFYEEVNND